ncbi:phage tail protein, partial [Pseudomonas aeruginosa]
MPWYSTGTVSVVLNSDTVTGSGTAFSANARAGDAFRGPDGRWYEIGNVSSAIVLTIKPAYQGATANGQAYSITPVQGYSKALADQLRD